MKRTHIFLLVLVSVVVAIIVSTYSESSSYGDFKDAEKAQTSLHIVGKYVRGKEITFDPLKDPNYFSFYLQDKEGVVKKVVYHQPKPVDFERSDQIVVVGKIEKEIFVASKILLKCPSKYNQDKI